MFKRIINLAIAIQFVVYGQMADAATRAVNDLSQLRDIHMPQPISGWSFSGVGYVVLGLLWSILAGICYLILRRHRWGRAKRQALRLLSSYETQQQDDPNPQRCCASISELLRRVALVYFPRQQIAGLRGRDWLDFLNASGKKIDFNSVSRGLLEQPYQVQDLEINISLLFSTTRRWIRQRRRPCLS
ncbi:MAG: DUF4381 domain-containing protein [Legionella sp.]